MDRCARTNKEQKYAKLKETIALRLALPKNVVGFWDIWANRATAVAVLVLSICLTK
jgi:hypothetical protein